MLDHGRRGKIRTDDRTPCREGWPLAEVDRMVLQRFPVHRQHIALGRLHAAMQLVIAKALGFAEHLFYPALHGGFKFGLLTGLDANIGKFEDHVRTIRKGTGIIPFRMILGSNILRLDILHPSRHALARVAGYTDRRAAHGLGVRRPPPAARTIERSPP